MPAVNAGILAMLVVLNRRILVAAALAVVAVLYARHLGPVLLPFVLGAALAYFLDPLADRLERMRLSRAGAVGIIVLGMMSLIAAAVLLLLPTLLGQIRQAVEALPNAVRNGFDLLMARFPEMMEDGGFLRQILSEVTERIRQSALAMLGGTLSTVISAVTAGFLFVATITVTIYLLYDWDRLVRGVDRRLPHRHAPMVRRVAGDIDDVLTGFVRGQVIVGALLATFYSTILMAIGLNYGLLIGLAAGILNFIPYLGSFSGFILATGVALVQFWGDWGRVALVGVIFVAGQIIEGNIVTQTHQAIRNVLAILAEAGYGPEHVVRCGVWLDDARDFPSFNKIFKEYFGANPPARACVQSSMRSMRPPLVTFCEPTRQDDCGSTLPREPPK